MPFCYYSRRSKRLRIGGDLNKNELEFAKLNASSRNLGLWLGFAKHVVTALAVVGLAHVMFLGLTNIVAAKPDSLNALAIVIEKMRLGSWFGYLVAMGASGGWFFERRGKKRAVRQLDTRRNRLEHNDPYHEGSGLTETGETPT